ncbi:hypothetical protein BU23DRAFT_588690 [Bimuria novae-zelandiae CBS 107.79]|uniref:Uncharacterized protein n=1 Tax=Bimuria novae-zelandiae CBS 107.79 TaxID=1447943 RepID=A0A6A5VEY5_9PLEO|nr:hypothetical protein BU23DRAFT_588690 [Bimuria novae-zelandiae CBS 107.79]
MRLPIAPIVSVATGLPPPTFPPTMLHLFLLTEPELDAMASFYSQTTPDSFTAAYPSTMDWTRDVLDRNPCLPEECRLSDEERLKVKMRMFARFIGMKGAETSVWEQHRRDELAENKKKWSAEEEIRELPTATVYVGSTQVCSERGTISSGAVKKCKVNCEFGTN